MKPSEQFILRLEALKEGERSRLRRLAGRSLDETVPGFDLFTGLWWPLRERSSAAPRRTTSWLVAKLYGAYPIPHYRPSEDRAGLTLPRILGLCEPRDEFRKQRFRQRFDTLLQASLPEIKPHLGWALSAAAKAVDQEALPGLDWARLLDDLSIWDRGAEHKGRRDIRDVWAKQYLDATQNNTRR